jgi:TonB family protein
MLEAPKIVDAKAVEAEARRLAAEREKAARDAMGREATAAKAGPAPAVLTLQPARAADVPKEVARAPEPLPVAAPPVAAAPPKQEPAAAPVPTEVSVAEKPPAIPAPSTLPVNEGDLVGPGEGVVEPKLTRLGAMTGMPPQARQIKRNADGSIATAVLMALVTEKGGVADTRIVQPSAYKFADEAAVRALKSATIVPATKDGVKVRMWKTFTIAVRP